MPDDHGSSDGWLDGGLDYLPVTVLVFLAVSALFTAAGVRPIRYPGSGLLPAVFEFVSLYVANMFMNTGPLHFLGNMFLLVLFGGALTLLTSNRHVAGVIVVAHVSASVWLDLGRGIIGTGSSLAVAGVIAATIVRCVSLVAGGFRSENPIDSVLGGTFALLVLALFGLTSLTGVLYLRIFDHHLGGWVFGALAELAWVLRERVRSAG